MPLMRQLAQLPGERAMSAPYNFVPLPEAVFVPGEAVPSALGFSPGCLSGTIEYTLRTLSPLYTRAATERGGKSASTAEFFHHGDPNKPFLPGSTMRGLARAMVGLVGDAHLPRTKRNRTLFYRSFGSDALAGVYGARFINKEPGTRGPQGALQLFRGKSEPGFLVSEGDRWVVRPAWALRVGHRYIGRPPYRDPPGRSRSDGRPIQIPDPTLQHRPVWFKAEGGDAAQRRGRLRFHDAPCLDSNPFLPPLTNRQTADRIPHILASPKPTAYQMYLVQPTHDKRALHHFGTDHATIRGTKLYWHRNESAPDGTRRPLPEGALFRTDRADQPSSQETVIRPVRAGVHFSGVLAFENLTAIELGALLTALDLPAGLAHKIGMGKPLGLGSVRLEDVRVKLIDRRERYREWGCTGDETADAARAQAKDARAAFRSAMVDHAKRAYGVDFAADTPLWDLPRQRTLSTILSWESPPPDRRVGYLSVTGPDGGKWRERNVLSAPHTVADGADPYQRVPGASPPDRPLPDRRPPPGPAQKQRAELPPENPDTLPSNFRVDAEIVGGGPGSWKARLVGGKRKWNIKGTPPPGLRPKMGDVVAVRIQRSPTDHLVFDQSTR